MHSSHPHQFLALGDSYTIGEGVTPVESWPYQLATALETQNFSISRPTIIAKTGWTTQDLCQTLQNNPPGTQYDLVSLLIGVNNQYRGWARSDYQNDFKKLLQLAIGYAQNNPQRVMVLSIPHWENTPYAKGRDRQKIYSEVQQFNTINQAETRLAQAHYIDLSKIGNQVINDPNLLGSDQLHPSARLYARWVTLITPVATRILEKQL